MNLVDDAKVRIEHQRKQLELVAQKELELAAAEQKLQEEIIGAVDMNTTRDETGKDVSIGKALLG